MIVLVNVWRTLIYYLAVSTTHPFSIIALYFASFNITFSIFYMFFMIYMLSCSTKPPSASTSSGSCNTAFRHCLKLRPPPTNSRSCDIAQNSWLAHAKPLCQCHPGLVQLSNFSQRAQYTALIFLSPQVFFSQGPVLYFSLQTQIVRKSSIVMIFL